MVTDIENQEARAEKRARNQVRNEESARVENALANTVNLVPQIIIQKDVFSLLESDSVDQGQDDRVEEEVEEVSPHVRLVLVGLQIVGSALSGLADEHRDENVGVDTQYNRGKLADRHVEQLAVFSQADFEVGSAKVHRWLQIRHNSDGRHAEYCEQQENNVEQNRERDIV